jgi:hypothetical protein
VRRRKPVVWSLIKSAARFVRAGVLIAAAGALALSACKADPAPEREPLSVDNGGQFEVKIVGEFYDRFAYNSYRRIYLMVDRRSGREYVGISGVGISEVGSHPSGKTTQQDER